MLNFDCGALLEQDAQLPTQTTLQLPTRRRVLTEEKAAASKMGDPAGKPSKRAVNRREMYDKVLNDLCCRNYELNERLGQGVSAAERSELLARNRMEAMRMTSFAERADLSKRTARAPAEEPQSPQPQDAHSPKSPCRQTAKATWRRKPSEDPAEPTVTTEDRTSPPARRKRSTSDAHRCHESPVDARRRASPKRGEQGADCTDNDQCQYQPRPGEEQLAQLLAESMSVPSGRATSHLTMTTVAGLQQQKRVLFEAVALPRLIPGFFQGVRTPAKGILLYGPPGTGKTMLAKAVAAEANMAFFNVSVATISSKWRGDSEKLVRVLFDMARFYGPSVVFIDEIDSIGGRRGCSNEHEASRRVKTELLVQMDGLHLPKPDESATEQHQVLVLAATNHPWDLDEALCRRLERQVYVPLPDASDRKLLFAHYLEGIAVESAVSPEGLAAMTEGRLFSAHDVMNVVREASMMPLRRVLETIPDSALSIAAASDIEARTLAERVTLDDFSKAIRSIPASVSSEHIDRFARWASRG